IVGLESGRVLRLDGDEWAVAAAFGATAAGAAGWRPSRRVLAEVREKKKTFWLAPRRPADADTPSLAPLQTVVAAPLLCAAGAVGGRPQGRPPGRPRLAAARRRPTGSHPRGPAGRRRRGRPRPPGPGEGGAASPRPPRTVLRPRPGPPPRPRAGPARRTRGR